MGLLDILLNFHIFTYHFYIPRPYGKHSLDVCSPLKRGRLTRYTAYKHRCNRTAPARPLFRGVPRSGGVCRTETIRIFDRFGIEKNAETGWPAFQPDRRCFDCVAVTLLRNKIWLGTTCRTTDVCCATVKNKVILSSSNGKKVVSLYPKNSNKNEGHRFVA